MSDTENDSGTHGGDTTHELDMECNECGGEDVFAKNLDDGEAVVKCRDCGKLATSWGAVL